MNRETADELVAGLGPLIGLPGLALDRAGLCQLVLDGRWLVTLSWQPRPRRLLLHCPISTPEASEGLGAAALREMLQGNFMGRGIGGATLAIGADRRACVQCDLAAPHPQPTELLDALEQLLQAAQAWSARLLSSPPAPPAGGGRGRPSFLRGMA